MPALVIFDLDKTLAASKQPLTPEMARLLARLLEHTSVAIISGGMFDQLKTQVVDHLPADAHVERLFILPTSGAALFSWSGSEWHPIYQKLLTGAQTQKIRTALETAATETGIIDLASPSYGDRIELRGAQVTLSALGQHAPIAEKEAWDADGSKKQTLRDAVAPMLPEFDVKIGGSTSIDVTLQGVNKAYGVRKLSECRSILIEDMLYVGDALYAGGNDEVVKETGIKTVQVTGPDETMQVITRLLTT